jgi:hypothetical protein
MDAQPALVGVHSINRRDGDRVLKQRFIYPDNCWDDQIRSSKLLRRGWVFQERILAPRILHFAEKQIFWECFEAEKCESFPMGVFLKVPFKNLDPLFTDIVLSPSPASPDPAVLWHRFVEFYSECSFTRDTDRLIAISGLARIFEERTGDIYMAGLLKSTLAQSLLAWYHEVPAPAKPACYIAPSWSWACTNKPLNFPDHARNKSFIEILDVKEVWQAPDSTAKATERESLTLKGFVRSATCLHLTNEWTYFRIGDGEFRMRFRADVTGAIPVPGSSYLILVLSLHEMSDTISGLAIRSSPSVPGAYIRLGTIWIREWNVVGNFGFCFTNGEDGGIVAEIPEERLSTITII